MAQLQQPAAPKRSAKVRWHRTARVTWIITSWIWTTIIIAFLIQLVPALLLISNEKDKVSNVSEMEKTPAYHIIQFLDPSQTTPSGFEIWKAVALGGILLFTVITLLAFLLKQLLRETGPENFDRILQALEQDIIPTQLDLLSKQLHDQSQQELQRQDRLFNGLGHIHGLLKQNLDASHWQDLQGKLDTMFSKQEEQFSVLRNLHTAFQSGNILHELQHLSILYEQEGKKHSATSTDLRYILQRLDELLEKLEVAIQTNQSGNTSHSGFSTDTEQTPKIHLLDSHPSVQEENLPTTDADDTSKLS